MVYLPEGNSRTRLPIPEYDSHLFLLQGRQLLCTLLTLSPMIKTISKDTKQSFIQKERSPTPENVNNIPPSSRRTKRTSTNY